MATYPLKNISIGGDTYEIQAGNVGTAYYSINIESYDSPDIWNHTGLTWNRVMKVWTDGSIQNVSFGDLYADEELHSWEIPIFVSLQVTGGGRGMWPCSVLGKTSGSYTIVADGVYNDTACYITITANTITVSSAYGETLSSGGGGGSVSVLNLTDGQGNPVRFDNAQQASPVQLRFNGTAQDFAQVSTLLQNGSVVIKDSVGSLSPIECTHSSSTTLIVPRFNGNTLDRLKLAHQWSGNYGVSTV